MPRSASLTQVRLKALLSYDPATGLFVWLVRRGKAKPGQVCTKLHDQGYIHIGIDGKKYFGHRLAWLYVYGVWPPDEIDHINGVRTDNRIANLRPATPSENRQNQAPRTGGTSHLKGVSWHTSHKKWRAVITYAGKCSHIGYYDTEQDANAAYAVTAAKVFGQFARAA